MNELENILRNEFIIVLFILFSFFFIVRSLSIIGLQNEIKKVKESL